MKKLNKKHIIRIVIGIVSALLALYIVSRFGHVITGPRIKLDSVPKDAISEPVLVLSGTIRGGRLFWINGVQMPIEKNGAFNAQLVVPPGYTIITLEAQDELGSRRKKEIPIYYLPASNEADNVPTEQPETLVPEESPIPLPVLE